MARLDQLLAQNLGIGRKAATSLVRRGKVATSTRIPLQDPGQRLTDATTKLLINGQAHTLYTRVALLLHKPRGCVTARKDALHPTAYALLKNAPLYDQLLAIGRLDKDTSGLLLWTSQGPEVHALTHPRRQIPRSYHVALHRDFQAPPEDLVLKDGHKPSIAALERLEPSRVHPGLTLTKEARVFATITLSGGAYHEVRRIFAALGSHVLELCRVSHGPWTLPFSLEPGQFELLDPATWSAQF